MDFSEFRLPHIEVVIRQPVSLKVKDTYYLAEGDVELTQDFHKPSWQGVLDVGVVLVVLRYSLQKRCNDIWCQNFQME